VTLAIYIYLFGLLCAWPLVAVDDDGQGHTMGYGAGFVVAAVWPLIAGLVVMSHLLGITRR
jgi:hypothetical protein